MSCTEKMKKPLYSFETSDTVLDLKHNSKPLNPTFEAKNQASRASGNSLSKPMYSYVMHSAFEQPESASPIRISWNLWHKVDLECISFAGFHSYLEF